MISRPTMRAQRAALSLGIMIAVGMSACYGPPAVPGPPPPPPKSTGDSEVQAAGTTPPTRLGGPTDTSAGTYFIPRKTPPLTDYFENLDESHLIGYLNMLVYDKDPMNAETETATCVHWPSNVRCAPTEGALVSIEPEIGAHKWPHNQVPRFGFVVARLINDDLTDRMEETFRIPARTQAWWVVDQDPVTHVARSRFFRRTFSSSPPYVEQLGTTHEFLLCGHAHNNGHSHAIGKFVNCSQSLTMVPLPAVGGTESFPRSQPGATGLFHLTSFGSSIPPYGRPEIMQLQATWVTCEMGCCSTSR